MRDGDFRISSADGHRRAQGTLVGNRQNDRVGTALALAGQECADTLGLLKKGFAERWPDMHATRPLPPSLQQASIGRFSGLNGRSNPSSKLEAIQAADCVATMRMFVT
jgi:hypothetical protein